MAKGFKMPGDLGGLMKQAQKLQQDLERVQNEAKQLTAEGSAGGGMVKAVSNGKNQVVSLTISAEVVNPQDIDMLQDLIVAAVNDSLAKVQDLTADAVKKITGGMSLPGL